MQLRAGDNVHQHTAMVGKLPCQLQEIRWQNSLRSQSQSFISSLSSQPTASDSTITDIANSELHSSHQVQGLAPAPSPGQLAVTQSPKLYSLYLCLFCCLAYRVIITIFLNSTYMLCILLFGQAGVTSLFRSLDLRDC